jgi:methionine-rich copper-binding protein CopC
VAPGETATITADLNHDNNGNLLSGGYLPDNLGVTFTGTVSPLSDTTQNGVATTTFTAGSIGTTSVSATVDGQTVSATINIGTLPLAVTSVDPGNNTVNVALNKVIQVTFNQDIKSGNNQIELKNTKTGKTEPFSTSINGATLAITPTNLLASGTLYQVLLHSGAVTDLSGNPVSAYVSQFTTMPPLTVSSTDPAHKATNVALNKIIQVTFNRDIQSGSNWIELLNTKTGKGEAITTSISGKVLTLTPTKLLSNAVPYLVVIHTGAVKDLSGNLVSAYLSQFTTMPALAVSSSDPANKAVNVPLNKVIQITFNQDLQAGTDWIELLNTKTNQFEAITTSINGKTLTITPTSTLNTATTYYILIHTGAVKDLYGNPVSANVIRFTTV